jgi:LacI family transcriptional regulator
MTLRKNDGVPTISDVAAGARVSRSTVSRAFSRPELINPSTVELVKKIAAGLGYVPNHAARALSTGLHGNIALIVPDIENPFFPPLIRAVQTSADMDGYSVFIGDSDENSAREIKLADRLINQVEGFVLASPRTGQQNIVALNQRRPVVAITHPLVSLMRWLILRSLGIVRSRMSADQRHLGLISKGGWRYAERG